jgi:hypothetical protein
MKLLKNNKLQILIIILISIISKLYLSPNTYTETDDLIAINQIKNYQNINIYDIANDKESETYDSDLKKKIRQIEDFDNSFYDGLINSIYFLLKRVAPSKHSTFAPLQYFLFSDVIYLGDTYKEIKFFSRLPSIFFATLTILITYVFAKTILKNQNRFLPLISVSFVAFSYPLMFISLRSYNYSASVFAVTLFFYLIYINSINQKNVLTVSNYRINFRSSLLIGLILSLLAHLSYVILFLSPLFFLILFFQNLFKNKILSNFNYNLIIIGLLFTIFMTPLLTYMLSFNLNEYGVTKSTGGEYYEYYFNLNSDSNTLVNLFQFYIQNSYLVIVKNLSFFIDKNIYSNFLQFLILILFMLGFIFSYKIKDKNINYFLNIFLIFVIYYFFLVLFGFVTLGPTRHLNSYTPLLAIVVSLGIYGLFKKLKFINAYLNLIVLSIVIIFCLNLVPFYKNYKDAFNENLLTKEIKESKIGLIINNPSLADNICLMGKVSTLTSISTCPLKNNRYTHILELNNTNLEYLKNNNLSLAFVNKKISNDELLLIQKYEFKLKKKIENIKFIDNSPLYISKYVPNYFIMEIYK